MEERPEKNGRSGIAAQIDFFKKIAALVAATRFNRDKSFDSFPGAMDWREVYLCRQKADSSTPFFCEFHILSLRRTEINGIADFCIGHP